MDVPLATRAVNRLLQADRELNRRFGLRVISVAPDRVCVGFCVKSDMVNSQGVCHGGIVFSLADSACAYAVATGNVMPITLDANISYLQPAKVGDELLATAAVIHRGGRLTRCRVEVSRSDNELVGVYQASCLHRGAVLQA